MLWLQAGLLSAYIIKKLYFGRFVLNTPHYLVVNVWSITRHFYNNSLIHELYLQSRHSTDREVSIMMLMAYLSYMLAEVSPVLLASCCRFQHHQLNVIVTDSLILTCCFLCQLLDLSGILTVFFCGIVMSHYTWHNVTESSRVTTK